MEGGGWHEKELKNLCWKDISEGDGDTSGNGEGVRWRKVVRNTKKFSINRKLNDHVFNLAQYLETKVLDLSPPFNFTICTG